MSVRPEQLLIDLQEQDPLRQMRALVLLSDPGFHGLASRVIPTLRLGLANSSWPFRRAIVDTLSEFGSDGAAVLAELVQCDHSLQWDAVEALDRMGEAVQPLWIDIFERSDSKGRVAILATLGQSSRFDPKIVVGLVQRGLQDEHADVRGQTTSAVSRHALLLTPLVDDFISALLRERNDQTQGLRPAPEGCEHGIYYVDDYIEALGNLGPAATPATALLRALLDDPDDDVRDQAFRAMLRIGPEPDDWSRLLEMYRQTACANGVPDLEWASLLVARGMDQHTLSPVTDWLFDENSRSIEAAAELLALTREGGRNTVRHLARAYDHADTQAKRAIL